MTHSIAAHFDGKVIVPEEPVDLPVGQSFRVRVELAEPKASASLADLLDLAAELPGAPTDLASQHDHYLYGTPKR